MLKFTEYQRRKEAESPSDVRYESDDADADDIDAVDRQEARIEYACDEDVAEVGQYRVNKQRGPAGTKRVPEIEYPAKLRILLTFPDGAHQNCSHLFDNLDSRPGMGTGDEIAMMPRKSVSLADGNLQPRNILSYNSGKR